MSTDDNNVRTMNEAFDELLQAVGKIDESEWGPWKLNRATRNVYMDFPPATYSLTVSDLQKDAFYETFAHLSKKTWADNECLGGLVRASFAIYDAIEDPLHKIT